MNVLSLFDGMSCGRIALERAGIPVTNYFASEIDKWAIQVSRDNYPDIKQLGTVENWPLWHLPKIDLMMAGSPCQGFSFAGKQLAFDDPRSRLYFEFEKALRCFKPSFWLLENVRMKKELQDIISERLGRKPIRINSNLLSAQDRDRLYWTNIDGVEQPDDRGILLEDIIENGVTDRLKAHCIDANYFKGINPEYYFKKHRRQLIFQRGRGFNKGGFKALNGKTPTLTTCSFEQNNFLATVDGYRKLTPVECERLQTVPDNYTACVSNSQRYKMLGNGWTVDVIAHILKHIKISHQD